MDDIKQGFRRYFKAGNQGIILSLIACIIGIGLMTLPRVMPKLLANKNSAVSRMVNILTSILSQLMIIVLTKVQIITM